MGEFPDPFKKAKEEGPILPAEFQGETLPMILRLKDVRAAAKDWKTFSSDVPFRVPIPSEERLRSIRQYPIELDPPRHTAYRNLVEPFFARPKQPKVAARLHALIDRRLDEALGRDVFDVVSDFAIPLQSYALACLLNVDEKEAERWISWGIHVFREAEEGFDGHPLEQYCEEMFQVAAENPGDDFFSALNAAEMDGRPLTREEKLGFANLTFAGGRDTIIHTVSRIIDYFASHPDGLQSLRGNPKGVKLAVEEFLRVFIPLTHLGRVCPHATEVHGHPVPAGGRVSLCWASANRDPQAFEDPNEVKLDRRPNPHVSFGFGAHLCLGATHSRVILRHLLSCLGERVSSIQIHDRVELLQRESAFERMIGFERLEASFQPL